MTSQKTISLWIVLLIAFIDWMGIGLVYPMFSSLLFHEHLFFIPAETSDAMRGFWLGILLAMMPVAQFFSSPILGILSDQKGRKPILKKALFLAIIGYLLSAFGVWEQSLTLLILGRFIVGVSAGSAAVVAAVLADMSAPEEKAKNFGLLNMACGVGFSVGPFLGGKLSDTDFLSWGGFDKPFLFAGLMALLNLIFLLYFFTETHKKPLIAPLQAMLGLKNVKKAFYMHGKRAFLFSIFLFCFGWTFFWEFIPVTWIEVYRLSTSQIAHFYAYGAVFYAISCGFFIRPIVNRIAPSRVLLGALFCSGVYTLFLLYNQDPKWLWGYIPFQQYLIALVFPTAAAMISNWVKDDVQGEVMGIFQSVQSCAFAVSPLLSGALIGLSYHMPIIVGGSAMLIASFIFAMGYRKEIFVKPL